MRKIISVFQRNYDGDRLIRDEVVPGAEWVLGGEGIATRKYDGACCAIIDGVFYKRYDAKKGKTPPDGFIPAQEPDSKTGHWPGWLRVGDGPEDRWFREAYEHTKGMLPSSLTDGTFEACGPHFQNNPEQFTNDILLRHGTTLLRDAPRTFVGLRDYLTTRDVEGIVFHHPDGRMAKVKKKDFGMKRQAGW